MFVAPTAAPTAPTAAALTALLFELAACSAPAATSAADAASSADSRAVPADATAPGGDAPGAPFWSSEMTATATDFYTRQQPEGSVELGAAEAGAADGRAARIVLPGLPALGNADRLGPAYASELATSSDDFHFGVYRARVRLAACADGEEVVNGIFTYFNDGADHDGDGIADNSEIDFEILCGTPHVLFMTVWTDYTFETETFRKWTRALDLDTGDIWQSPDPTAYGIELAGNDPSLILPGLLDPSGYVELGFEWRADRVRYFATVGGQERTLAELDDPDLVPQLPGHLMFNVWHPAQHWFGAAGSPDYPANDAIMYVDRAAYWK